MDSGSSAIWGGKMTRDEVESFRDYNPLEVPFTQKGWEKLNIGEKLMLVNPYTAYWGAQAIANAHRNDIKDISEMRLGPAGYGPKHQNYEEKDNSAAEKIAGSVLGLNTLKLGLGIGGRLFTQG